MVFTWETCESGLRANFARQQWRAAVRPRWFSITACCRLVSQWNRVVWGRQSEMELILTMNALASARSSIQMSWNSDRRTWT